jgi:dihydroorotate dehydrogenase
MIEFDGRIGHLEYVESPWANAGGVVKTLEDVELMARTGVGMIEAGSYTLAERLGNGPNGETVYYHDPVKGETYNSLGMPNKGMDKVETEIPEMVRIAHAYNKKLVVNVAPVSNQPEKESLELVRRAYDAGADAVILNAGCPNVVTEDGGRHEILSRSPTKLLHVLDALVAIDRSIFVRLSPQYTGHDTARICGVIKRSRVVSAVLTPNTWPGHQPKNANGEPILQVPGGIGGKSGPAMSEDALYQTAWVVQALKGSGIDTISSSSVMNGKELARRMQLGAVAGAGTTFFYESQNGWQDDTNRLLSELAEQS